MDASVHPDSKVATAHWWYMSLRRSGRDDEARACIQGMDLDGWAPEVIESGAYLELLRLYAEAERATAASPVAEMDSETAGGGHPGLRRGQFPALQRP